MLVTGFSVNSAFREVAGHRGTPLSILHGLPKVWQQGQCDFRGIIRFRWRDDSDDCTITTAYFRWITWIKRKNQTCDISSRCFCFSSAPQKGAVLQGCENLCKLTCDHKVHGKYGSFFTSRGSTDGLTWLTFAEIFRSLDTRDSHMRSEKLSLIVILICTRYLLYLCLVASIFDVVICTDMWCISRALATWIDILNSCQCIIMWLDCHAICTIPQSSAFL